MTGLPPVTARPLAPAADPSIIETFPLHNLRNVRIVESVVPGENLPVGTMVFEATALVDNQLSKNRRFYSEDFNRRCTEKSNRRIEAGNVATIYSSHTNAFSGAGWLSSIEALPVGNVQQWMKVEGSADKPGTLDLRGIILPTAEGRDVQLLVRAGTMPHMSIRGAMEGWKTTPGYIGDEEVEIVEDGALEGIDFTIYPGVVGAGVNRILESAPTREKQMKVEDIMDWSKVTKEELVQSRPDLVTALQSGLVPNDVVSLLEAKVNDLSAIIEENKKGPAQEALDVLQQQVASLTLENQVMDASMIGISRSIADKLRATVKTAEEIPAALPAIRAEAIAQMATGVSEKRGNPGGTTLLPTEKKNQGNGASSTNPPARMTELQRDIIVNAGGKV